MSRARDVAVAVAPSREIAEMWAELLAEEGIAYRLSPEGTGATGLVPSMAAWEVRVATSDAARALELLPSEDSGEPADDEDDDNDDSGDDDDDDEPLEEPTSGSADRAMLRLIIVVIAIVIALLILFYGARSFG